MRLLPMLMVCLCLNAMATDAYAAAPTGLDRIAAYAGTWKTETEHFDTPFSKVGRETATLKNDCWRSDDFYACHQIVNGKSAALIVFLYDAKTGSYVTHALPADGSPAGNGTLMIKGDVWTFPWNYTNKGKTTYFHVINVFTSPDHIEYRQEYSSDKIHWTAMAKGHEIKQAP